MATYKHLRSSTANKRPTTTIADGQLAINTNTASPGLFFKDSAGTGIVKVGPVHVGTTAPNSVPASGGSSGNYTGEQWLDTSVSPAQMKVWNGSTWVGIVADELPVSKLQDGAARQLIQTDAAGTGVEWTSSIDLPGTLDVTSTATFDSIAQHPLGTAGAPTITFTGDTNTGIYSPGADQVAISTNGTGRLFVDANGNVQIGSNTSTGARVDITASSDIFSFGSASRRLYAWADSGGVSLLNADSQTGDGFYIDEAGSNIRFWTGSTERMRLDSSGRLGLGTSSPLGTLSVGNHANDVGQLNDVFVSGDKVNADGYFARLMFRNSNQSGGSTASVRGERSGDNFGTALTFYTQAAGSSGDGTEKLRITPAGNVGIGTTAPGAKLVVSDTNAVIAAFGRTGTTGAQIALSDSVSSAGIGCSSGALTFGANGYDTERARIDSSGRLLVGTSSARTSLSFASVAPSIQLAGGTTSESSLLLHKFGNDANPCKLILLKNRGGDASSNGGLSVNDPLGIISFEAADGYGGSTLIGAEIGAYAETGHGSANDDAPSRLVFSTTADGASSPTERMRIQANGRIGFGCTPDGTVSTTGVQTGGAEGWIIAKRADQPCIFVNRDNTDGPIVDIYRSGTLVGTISVTTTATAYNTSSDYRLKENVVPLTGAADRVNQLQVHRFNFIADPDKTVDGFLAHEAQAVVPECVTGEKDAVDENGNPVYQGIDQSKLVPLLTAALQEALAEIENLKARVTALEP
jgi:hypothetical protein